MKNTINVNLAKEKFLKKVDEITQIYRQKIQSITKTLEKKRISNLKNDLGYKG